MSDCTCGGIDAVPHATDHKPDCAVWEDRVPCAAQHPIVKELFCERPKGHDGEHYCVSWSDAK